MFVFSATLKSLVSAGRNDLLSASLEGLGLVLLRSVPGSLVATLLFDRAHSSFRERHGDVTVRKAEEVESLFSDAQVDVEGGGSLPGRLLRHRRCLDQGLDQY